MTDTQAPFKKRLVVMAIVNVAAVLAAVVCLARVYVGAHLPLDVIGGAALGIGVGLLVQMALRGSSR